jgi:hypothetical protein
MVRGCVVLNWSDGRTLRTEVAGIANSGPLRKETTAYLGDDIQTMTQTAIQNLADNWLAQKPMQAASP